MTALSFHRHTRSCGSSPRAWADSKRSGALPGGGAASPSISVSARLHLVSRQFRQIMRYHMDTISVSARLHLGARQFCQTVRYHMDTISVSARLHLVPCQFCQIMRYLIELARLPSLCLHSLCAAQQARLLLCCCGAPCKLVSRVTVGVAL